MSEESQQNQQNQQPQNPTANQNVTEQQQSQGLLGGVRDMAEQQVEQVIDNLATKRLCLKARGAA